MNTPQPIQDDTASPGFVQPDCCAALVAKWRDHAKTIDAMAPISERCGHEVDTMRKHAANAFRACANELEAAMQHNAPAHRPTEL